MRNREEPPLGCQRSMTKVHFGAPKTLALPKSGRSRSDLGHKRYLYDTELCRDASYSSGS